eukprot:gene8812-biopygen8965
MRNKLRGTVAESASAIIESGSKLVRSPYEGTLWASDGTPMVTSEVGDNKLLGQTLAQSSTLKKSTLITDVGSGDEVKSGRTQGTCGNNMAFTLSPSHTAVDSTNYSEYTELQLQRSKGREYPQQEMVQEDLAHLHDLLEHYAKSIKNLKKMPLLELGARTGWGTAYMRSKGWVSAQGLELSKQAAEFAQSESPPYLTKLLSLDAVLSSHVLMPHILISFSMEIPNHS